MAEQEPKIREVITAGSLGPPENSDILGQSWSEIDLMPPEYRFNTPVPQMTVSLMGTDAMGAEVFKGVLLQGHKFKAVFAPPNPNDALRQAVEEENEKREEGNKIDLYDLVPDTESKPGTMKDPETIARFSDENTDLGIFASVTYIAPEAIYAGPKRKTIGIHDSYLDNGRGGNAAGNAIIKTEKDKKDGTRRVQMSGVSVYEVTTGEDEGDKFFQQQTAIWDTDNTFNLFPDSTLPIGSKLMVNTVEMFARGLENKIRTPQDLTIDTKEKLIGKRWIDWNRPSVEIYDELRGALPYLPFAELTPGEEVDIDAHLAEYHPIWNLRAGISWMVDKSYPDVEPGTVVEIGEKGMIVTTADSAIRVEKIQQSSARRGKKTGKIIEIDTKQRGKSINADQSGITVGYKFMSPNKELQAA